MRMSRRAGVDFVVRSVHKSDWPGMEVIDRLVSPKGEGWTTDEFAETEHSSVDFGLVAILPPRLETMAPERVGFVLCSLRSSPETAGDHDLIIMRLSVHPEWQRCGIGSSLYHIAKREIPEPACEIVHAPLESIEHAAFWTGLGFTFDRIVLGSDAQGRIFSRRNR